MSEKRSLVICQAIEILKKDYQHSLQEAALQAGTDIYKRRNLEQLVEEWWNTPPEKT